MANRVYDGLFYDAPFDTTYSMTFNDVNNTFSSGVLTVECGFYTDPVIYEGDFTFSYIISSIQYKELDGGPINVNASGELMHDTGKNLYLDDTSSDRRTVVLSASDAITSDVGSIYIKDATTGRVSTLSASMMDLMQKLPNEVQSQVVSSVMDFNVYNDLMYVRTPNYMVIEKIIYDTSIKTGAPQSSVISNLHDLYVCSSPFFFEQRDYAMLCTISAMSAEHNTCLLMPSIYKLDYSNAFIRKMQVDVTSVEAFTNTLPVKIIKCTNPVLTYNSRNNVYAIVCTVLDANHMSYLYQIFFEINDENAIIHATRLIQFDALNSVTINWRDSESTSMFKLQPITSNTIIDVNQGSMNIHG